MSSTQTTWSFWQLIKTHRIEIPIIQRDYAQGRNTEEVRTIRSDFVDDLVGHLRKQDGTRKHLDFVYGKVRGRENAEVRRRNQQSIVMMLKAVNSYAQNLSLPFEYDFKASIEPQDHGPETFFVPLDGQQRLTTLYLLHWYLAWRSGYGSGDDQVAPLLFFSYQTRPSSGDFCRALVESIQVVNPDEDAKCGKELSACIEGAHWFFAAWRHDLTVQGMLTMLDAFHDRLKDEESATLKQWLQQLQGDSPSIVFDFLDMEGYELTDELYLKMNARGKTLSPFEKFKAAFEKALDDELPDESWELKGNGETKKVTARAYFAHKVDTTWLDLLWKNRQDHVFEVDEYFMRLLRHAFILGFAVKTGFRKRADDFGDELGHLRNTKVSLNAKYLAEHGMLTQEIVGFVFNFFDLLAGEHGKVRVHFPKQGYYREESVFKAVIHKAKDAKDEPLLSYDDFLLVYGFYGYLLEERHPDAGEFKEWLRIIHNLVVNTRQDGVDRFRRSIVSITELLPHRNNLHHYLTEWRAENGHTFPKNQVTSFSEWQVEEERLKAHLFLKDEEWKEPIHKAEEHGYFKGQIDFLLKFSGVRDAFFSKNRQTDWNKEDDEAFRTAFVQYFDKANTIFDGDGLRSSLTDFVWERALLATDDYLLKKKESLPDYNFLVSRGRRELTWKRLLRGASKEEKVKQPIVKKLLDQLDSSNIEPNLEGVIDHFTTQDWRLPVVKYPDLIGICNQRFIRWQSEWEVYLLGQAQMNHYHSELYSIAFKCRLVSEGLSILPFTHHDYHRVKGGAMKPYFYLDGWSYQGVDYRIQISFDGRAYLLEIAVSDEEVLDSEILSWLDSKAYSTMPYSGRKWFGPDQVSDTDHPLNYENEVYQALTDLLKELRNIDAKPQQR